MWRRISAFICGILAEDLRRAEVGVESGPGDDVEEQVGDRLPRRRGDLGDELAFESGVGARAVAPVQDERLERAPGGDHRGRVVARAHSRQKVGVARLRELRRVVAAVAELAEERDRVPQVPFADPELVPDSTTEALAVDRQATRLATVEPFEAVRVEVRQHVEGGHEVADDRPTASHRQLFGNVTVVDHARTVAENLDAALSPLTEGLGEREGVLGRHDVRRHRRAVSVDMAVELGEMREREADRAVVHRFVQHVLELLPLGGIGRPGLGRFDAHHVDQHRIHRDVARDVDAKRLALQVLDPLGERRPVPTQRLAHGGVGHLLGVLHHAHVALAMIRRAGREAEPAVAHGDGRAPVPARARAVGVPVQLGVVVGVEIDHARGDDASLRVDLAGRGTVTEGPDLLDAAIRDADVGDVSGELRAVDDGSGFEHQVVVGHAIVSQVVEPNGIAKPAGKPRGWRMGSFECVGACPMGSLSHRPASRSAGSRPGRSDVACALTGDPAQMTGDPPAFRQEGHT